MKKAADNKETKPANTPMENKEDVKNNPDNKIDEDFSGFPDGEAKESTINPKTPTERKTAQVDTKKVKNTSGPSH